MKEKKLILKEKSPKYFASIIDNYKKQGIFSDLLTAQKKSKDYQSIKKYTIYIRQS